jgi:acyl dehydratase
MSEHAVFDPIAGVKPGTDLGHSHWITVTQEMIDKFADATLDPDPMHIDPEWARTQGPFGSTVAFGFLTMSLLTNMLHDTVNSPPGGAVSERGYYLNYGFDRLRLISPVPVGARIRGRFSLARREQDGRGRWLAKFHCTIELEGQDKPALVGEWLSLWVPPPANH